MKNKIPKTLKVGHRIVTIEFKDIADDGFNGRFMASSATISLAKDLKGVHLVQVLLHELNHAIIHTYIDNNTSYYDRVSEEMFVDQQSKGLVQIIRDNPKFMPWVMEQINE